MAVVPEAMQFAHEVVTEGKWTLGRYLDGGPHPDCQDRAPRHPYEGGDCAAIPMLRAEGVIA